ncbi:MAG: thioredoxin family protein [Rubrimonas sp.]
MLQRSTLFAAAIAFGAPVLAEVGEDGLHKQDWFALTFKDVAEDMAAAREDGKRLMLIFEQRGCIYCAKLHEEILSDPEVRDFMDGAFMVVQYNLFGDEEVTDLDGATLTEKSAARRWGVVFTPTMIFLPDEAPEGGTVAQAAAATMPGAFDRLTFLHMLRWVSENGPAGDEHFQSYHARLLAERRAAGERTSD